MKSLRKTILVSMMVVGLAFSVPAQKDDQKRPPKDPPVIVPKEDKGPRKPPKGDDKPKKPGSAFY